MNYLKFISICVNEQHTNKTRGLLVTCNKYLYAPGLIAVHEKFWPGLTPGSPDAVRCRAGPGLLGFFCITSGHVKLSTLNSVDNLEFTTGECASGPVL